MSIIAYLFPKDSQLKMPGAEKAPNQCGIVWEGPVLSGKRSVKPVIDEPIREYFAQNPTSKTK